MAGCARRGTVARAWPANPLFKVFALAFMVPSLVLTNNLLLLADVRSGLALPAPIHWSAALVAAVILSCVTTAVVFAAGFYLDAGRDGRVLLWLEDHTGTATMLLRPEGPWTKAVFLASRPRPRSDHERGRARALAEYALHQARDAGRPLSCYALPGLACTYERGGLTIVDRPWWGLGRICRLEDHGASSSLS